MNSKRILTVGTVTAALLVPTAGIAMAQPTTQAPGTNVITTADGGHGGGQGGGKHGSGQDSPLGESPAGTLNSELKAHLIYLAEEEKVAHDLYVLAYETWGITTFSNISRSEDRHFDILNQTLELYDLPFEKNMGKAGVFTDPGLQAIYNELSKDVLASAEKAVAVGVKAEKGDIKDLKAGLAMSPPSDVREVLSNLVTASEKHLAAFQKQVDRLSGQEITVKAAAVQNRSKIRVNVNPNKKTVNYKFKVQKKINGKWKTKKVRWTKGTKDVRTVNMVKGTYRIKVPAQYGMDKEFSNVVRLRR